MVVGGQVQEQAGLAAGIAPERTIRVVTQEEAVAAVRTGQAHAYASVAMAHRGYLAREPDAGLSVVGVPAPASGAFAFGKQHAALRARLDAALEDLIGSD